MADESAFSRELLAIKGQTAWKPVRTHGSMFILDIGKPTRRPGDIRDHGNWSLLVEHGRWSFFRNRMVIVTSMNDAVAIDQAFLTLEMGEISSATFNLNRAVLSIDLGKQITVNVAPSIDSQRRLDDQWLLYTPAGGIWVANGDGVAFEPAPSPDP